MNLLYPAHFSILFVWVPFPFMNTVSSFIANSFMGHLYSEITDVSCRVVDWFSRGMKI